MELINLFYNKSNIYSHKIQVFDEKEFIEYKGYYLYVYYSDHVYIIQDKFIVGEYAGVNGAKRAIDDMTNQTELGLEKLKRILELKLKLN